ncbi:MAG: glycosyltransferase family 2 protein [Brevinema sp.]
MNTPIFSIVIPVYNTEKFLKQCLDSCVNQNMSDIEVIVINNGSSGDTKAITDQYSFVKYLHYKENLGVFEARKQGFLYSTGQYIIYCDSDDWFENNILKEYIKQIPYNPDLIVGQTLSVHPKYKEKALWANKGLSKVEYNVLFDLYSKREFTSWAFWGKCFRRDILLDAYKILDVNQPIVIWEDFLLFTATVIFCKKVIYVPKVVMSYRINSASFTNNISLHAIEIDLIQMDEVFKNLSILQQYLDLDDSFFTLLKKELFDGFLERISGLTLGKEMVSKILKKSSIYFTDELILQNLLERQKIRSHFLGEYITKLAMKFFPKNSKQYQSLKRLLLLCINK